MKITIRKSLVRVIGRIWMPAGICAMEYQLNAYQVENAKDDQGRITRESLDRWLSTNSGDFQSVTDFWASIEVGDQTVEIPWANEDSECEFSDCTCPAQD